MGSECFKDAVRETLKLAKETQILIFEGSMLHRNAFTKEIKEQLPLLMRQSSTHIIFLMHL